MHPLPPPTSRADPLAPRRRRRGPYVLAATVGLVAVLLAWIYWPVPVPPLRIAKDTTYLTGPLHPDGTVNYLAALNEVQSQGVTPENNAAIPLLQALGPEMIQRPEIRTAVLEQVGVELAKGGQYFVPFADYVLGRRRDLLTKTSDGQPIEATVVDVENQVTLGLEGQLAPEHRALLEAWLEANEAALSLVVQAAERPNLYVPFVSLSQPAQVAGSSYLTYGLLRDAGKALAMRAQLRLIDGDAGAAWWDCQAVHRLGLLCGKQIHMVLVLAGVSLDSYASLIDTRIGEHPGLPADRVRAMLEELRVMAEVPSVYRAIDLGERCSILDGIMQVVQGAGQTPSQVREPFYKAGAVDFNIVLQHANYWIDSSLAPLRSRDWAEQRRLQDEHENAYAAMRDSANNHTSVVAALIGTPRVRLQARSQLAGNMLTLFMLPSFGKPEGLRLAGSMRRRLAETSLALAVYRKERGNYPAALEELVPEYLPVVPIDVFSGKPLIYKPANAGYLLYSVGMNAEDNGGQEGGGSALDDLTVRVGTATSNPVESD